ncbi:MAG: nitroreductase [Aeromicrobium sp.]
MADFETLERLLTSRRSCRGFTDEQVPREVIEQLLGAAQRTASWCNTQPWQVVITSGEATTKLREALLESPEGFGTDFDFPTGYSGVYDERRKDVGWQLYEAVGVTRGDREASGREMLRNYEFFGAPHAAIITTEADLGVYGAIDCGLYVDSFLLAAEALGIGTCAQAAVAMRSPFLRDWFDLPDSRKVVCASSFGYADPEHPSANFTSRRAAFTDAASFYD